jgi:hypothetical protein
MLLPVQQISSTLTTLPALQVREFLLQKIYTLKRPKTNIQIIQQNVLLKYKYFIRFLRQHGKEIYDEVSHMGLQTARTRAGLQRHIAWTGTLVWQGLPHQTAC